MPPIVSTHARLAVGPSGGPVNQRLDFARFDAGVGDEFADANRNVGELSRKLNRVRKVRTRVAPPLSLVPTATELDAVLAWVTGGTVTGTTTKTYPLGAGVPVRSLAYADGGSPEVVYTYNELAVRRAVFRSSDTDPTLSVDLSLLGKDVTTAAAFPGGLVEVDETSPPFVHSDSGGAVLVNSAATLTRQVEIEIDNRLLEDRFFNSLILSSFVKVDRAISVRLMYPLGEAPALYDAGGAGVPVSVAYTNGVYVLTLTLPAVQFPRRPIEVPLRDEVVHALDGFAYRTDPSEALVVTLKLS